MTTNRPEVIAWEVRIISDAKVLGTSPSYPEWAERDADLRITSLVSLSVYETLQSECGKLVEALEGLLAITDESLGVSGYHLNGDIAKWCEFEDVAMAEEALAAYRQQGGEL